MTDNSPSKGGIDWLTIQNEFVAGLEYSELAQKHGIKEATIRQRAKRGDWSQLRHNLSQLVTNAAMSSAIEVKSSLLAELNEIDLTVATALRNKANEMLDTISTPNELKSLANTFDLAQRISRLALGASTDNSTVTNKELPATIDDFV